MDSSGARGPGRRRRGSWVVGARLGVVLTAALALVSPAGAVPAQQLPATAVVDPFAGFGTVDGQSAASVFGRPPANARLVGVGESWVRWDLGDGRFQSEISPGVERVDTGSGWGFVDESLVPRDGGWSPLRIGADVRFSGGGDRVAVSMTTEGVVSRLVWDGPDPLPAPVIDGAVATYQDLLPGVDLMLRTGPVSVQYAWRFGPVAAGLLASAGQVGLRIESDGASPAQDGAAGGVVLTPPGLQSTGPGAVGQLLAAGGWQDSAGGARGDAWPLVRDGKDEPADAVGPVTVRLDGDELLWSWDAQPLGADAVFPLYARSAQSDIGRAYWLMVWSNGYTFYDDPVENARVGYDGWSGENKVSRSFYRFPVSHLFGMSVLSAQFWHAQVHSPNNTCNQAAWGSAVNYADAAYVGSGGPGWPGPGIGLVRASDVYGHGNRNYCPGDTRRAFEATAQVRDAINGGVPDLNSVLFSSNEGDREGWRQYDNRTSAEGCTDQGGQWAGNCMAPRLVVIYTPVPATPADLSVADAYVDPEGVLPGVWMGVRHATAAGFTVSAVVNTSPPGQAATLAAFFYLQTADGASTIASTSSGGWPPGSRASGLLCSGAPCVAHLGDYRLLVHSIVDGGDPAMVGEATLPLRADLQPPAAPQLSVSPSGQAGVWTAVLHNPAPAETDLRRLSLGASPDGLWDFPLSTEQMQAYRSGQDVTVEVTATGPVVSLYAQSWDVARNASPVGAGTGVEAHAGPSSVWPLDGDGTNLVPGGPELVIGDPAWREGRWAVQDPRDRALGPRATAESTGPVTGPAAGFVFSAWLQPRSGAMWSYGPSGSPTIRLDYAAGVFTAQLAGAGGTASVALPAVADGRPPLAAGWSHVSVWYHPGLGVLGLTVDGTRTATTGATTPAGSPDDRLRLPGEAEVVDQFTVTSRAPDRYYLAALPAAPRPDFAAGGQQ